MYLENIANKKAKTVILGSLVLILAACESGPEIGSHPGVKPFKQVQTPFVHQWTEPSHPFTGAAVIDIDNDGVDEIFVGGGASQNDALLSLKEGQMVDIISGSGLEGKTGATHGMVSTDMDLDGDVDLFVARDSGLFAYENSGGQFTSREIPIKLENKATALSVSAADIDNDGDVDLYVSAFVAFPAFQSATFNDPAHAKKNIILLNNGDMTFSDITETSGAKGLQNTFHAVFVNLDQDKDLDLVLAQNTGEIEILENMGDGTFKDHPTNSGYGFWMGLGIGDYDQDGDQDILVSNAGTSIPKFLTTGDILETQNHNINWALLQNNQDFSFKDMISENRLDGYGFGWGALFEDLNLDGSLDAMMAQNYIKWPVHNLFPLEGKVLFQLDTGEGKQFYSVGGYGLENPHYGQTPMIADLNGNGRPDVLWLNMNGPLTAFLNQSEADFITINLPDSPKAQGSEVSVTLSGGTQLKRQLIASTGLMSDQTSNLFFGIPNDHTVSKVEVKPLTGESVTLDNPALNRTHRIRF